MASGTIAIHTDALADPCWFPESFDARRREFLLVSTDRSSLATQTFLDARWERPDSPRMRVSSTVDRLSHTNIPTRIIWHTGFCCSTLLAKALDRPNHNLSLCEPQVLVEIAEARRTEAISRDGGANAAQLAFYLLSRSFVPSEHVTIKPSPAANGLLRLIPRQWAGPMLFLYSDCRAFLISIYKMGEEGRKYIRRIFVALLADGHVQARWPTANLLSMSDLELSAVVWHMQIAEFLQALPAVAPQSVASLDCDAFLASPKETMIRLDRFFSLDIGPDHLQEVIDGPLFRHNVKTGEAQFDTKRRVAEHWRVEQEIREDLDRIVAQSYQICRETPRSVPLPNPLVPINKSYCPGD